MEAPALLQPPVAASSSGVRTKSESSWSSPSSCEPAVLVLQRSVSWQELAQVRRVTFQPERVERLILPFWWVAWATVVVE